MIDFIRATERNEFELIEKLADTIWREHYIPIVGEPQIDYMLKKLQSTPAMITQYFEGVHYYIIRYNNEPVGYLAIKQEENLLFLSKIYILENYRGNQIGAKSLEFVEEKAEIYRMQGIRLTVNVNNAKSISFYEKLGFTNNGPLITYIGDGFIMDDYEMIKII